MGYYLREEAKNFLDKLYPNNTYTASQLNDRTIDYLLQLIDDSKQCSRYVNILKDMSGSKPNLKDLGKDIVIATFKECLKQ